ncbi:MAG: hypothetical protein M3Z24_09520, partial [Chloroflexota bacterium]|nr:hypothetical protein [Chloroflexota bacterium]
DTFEHADTTIHDQLAGWIGMSTSQFALALKQRKRCLQRIARGKGVDSHQMYDAINELRSSEKKP